MAAGPSIRLVTSAGVREGRGHVSRSVTLAEAVRRAGGAGLSVGLELLRGDLSEAERSRLDAVAANLPSLVAARHDATVVDLPDPNEVAGRWPADRLVVIDDSNRLTTKAAIVVQPSRSEWTGRADVGSVLAGYTYAALRPSLRRLAQAQPAPSGPPDVLVCFGGSDPDDVTARLVPAVAASIAARGDGTSLTAVVGASYRGRLNAERGWRVLQDPIDFDDRLARATVALIGGGTLKFEAAHLGIPAVVVAVADDQPDVAAPMAVLGMATYLGDGRDIEPDEVGSAIDTLLDDPDRRAAMSKAGRATVDGRGAERIAAQILAVARSL